MSAPVSRPASRIAQGAAALVLAALVSLAPALEARAGDTPTTTDPGLAAIGWIAQQVENDPTLGAGSYVDAIFAFAAMGAGGDAADAALAALEANLEGYVAPGGTLAPGALAKAMLAVQVMGGDPTSFGGRDLEADLRSLIVSGGADDGRFGAGGPVDQALGILALSRTAGGAPAATVTWLARTQCPSGEFSWDASCPGAPGSEDPDTTAIAIQALLATGATTEAGAATTWLLSTQQPGGGLPSFGTANTNSSGVGGQALRAAGEMAAADAAAAFVLSLAIGCDGAAADVGAIGWAEGIPGFLIFSTPQAVLALGAPPLDMLSADGIAPEAPVLACATGPAETPTPIPSVSAAPATPAPTGEELPNTATSSGSGGDATFAWPALVFVGALAAAAHLGFRREHRTRP